MFSRSQLVFPLEVQPLVYAELTRPHTANGQTRARPPVNGGRPNLSSFLKPVAV